MNLAADLLCPVCRERLVSAERGLACVTGHRFDQAREGYVHLLPGGARGKFPGDSKQMLQARRRFFGRGLYDPLAAMLNGQVQMHLNHGDYNGGSIAEAGCGEGFYIGKLRQHLMLDMLGNDWHFWGFDLAKEAVRLAAKRYSQVDFFVADTYQPWLFTDASLTVLLNIFAPRNPMEMARVIQPGGILLVVLPGPQHLLGIPPVLSPVGVAAGKVDTVIGQFSGLFKLSGKEYLELSMMLDSEAVVDLMLMTPNQRHIAPAQLINLPSMKIQAEFIVLQFQRC